MRLLSSSTASRMFASFCIVLIPLVWLLCVACVFSSSLPKIMNRFSLLNPSTVKQRRNFNQILRPLSCVCYTYLDKVNEHSIVFPSLMTIMCRVKYIHVVEPHYPYHNCIQPANIPSKALIIRLARRLILFPS